MFYCTYTAISIFLIIFSFVNIIFHGSEKYRSSLFEIMRVTEDFFFENVNFERNERESRESKRTSSTNQKAANLSYDSIYSRARKIELKPRG